ncbi:hypothetical protein D043_2530B, partial [Vibrio parahaemolyticus EKP-021]
PKGRVQLHRLRRSIGNLEGIQTEGALLLLLSFLLSRPWYFSIFQSISILHSQLVDPRLYESNDAFR